MKVTAHVLSQYTRTEIARRTFADVFAANEWALDYCEMYVETYFTFTFE